MNEYRAALIDALADRAGTPVRSQEDFFAQLLDRFSEQYPDLSTEGRNGPIGQIARMVHTVWGPSLEQILDSHEVYPDEGGMMVAEAFLGYERRRTHPVEILDSWFDGDGPTLVLYFVYADRDGGVHARRLVGSLDQDYHAD